MPRITAYLSAAVGGEIFHNVDIAIRGRRRYLFPVYLDSRFRGALPLVDAELDSVGVVFDGVGVVFDRVRVRAYPVSVVVDFVRMCRNPVRVRRVDMSAGRHPVRPVYDLETRIADSKVSPARESVVVYGLSARLARDHVRGLERRRAGCLSAAGAGRLPATRRGRGAAAGACRLSTAAGGRLSASAADSLFIRAERLELDIEEHFVNAYNGVRDIELQFRRVSRVGIIGEIIDLLVGRALRVCLSNKGAAL